MLRLVFIAVILAVVFTFNAQAAAVWVADPLRYYKYDTTPLILTDSNYKHLATTESEAVNVNWARVGGTYIKYTTAAGGVKYAEEVVTNQPPANDCVAVVCRDNFGVTINLAALTALDCPKVKITSEQIQFYEGMQILDGVPVCHRL